MTFRDFINYLIGFINLLMPVVGGLALLAFFRGLAAFIYNSGDSKKHQDGRNLMIWGVLGLFVMISFLGIITIIKHDLGLNTTTGIPVLPQQQ